MTTTAKFTPGPRVSKGRYVGTPNHMSYIAECRDTNGNWTNEPMAVANARLIDAAPELLEALKDAYPYIDNPHLRLKIGAVISKAMGIA